VSIIESYTIHIRI